MIEYTQKELLAGLKEIGIRAGDTLLVSTELFTLGKLSGAKNQEDYCRMILEAVLEATGDRGTIAVNAFTNYVGRYGETYVHEKSRPNTGAFSEYVLFHPESVRSLHPLNSLAALGHAKQEICSNVSASNYGIDSPYDRLLKKNCQVLRLGIDYVHNSFLHMVEAVYGLPYIYNKILDAEVVVGGEKVNRQFFAAVRYLEYPLDYSHENIKKKIDQSGCVHSARVGAGHIHRLDANEYCRILVKMIKEDPYAFLKQPPPFIKGEKPWDGITAGRDGVHKTSDYRL